MMKKKKIKLIKSSNLQKSQHEKLRKPKRENTTVTDVKFKKMFRSCELGNAKKRQKKHKLKLRYGSKMLNQKLL